MYVFGKNLFAILALIYVVLQIAIVQSYINRYNDVHFETLHQLGIRMITSKK